MLDNQLDFDLFITEGLGDNSYLLSSGSEAVIIDPQRDIWRFLDTIHQQNLKLVAVLETHVHNDYISGALELKDELGSKLLLPGKGDYEFEHTGVSEGFCLSLGDLEVKAIDTPGHTYEHISWVVERDSAALGVFTGGSLIVGSAGRTDLLGDDHTQKLTTLQYETVQKLKQYPNETAILPTHGQGSFCTSSNPSSERISTLKQEKIYNQAVTATNLEEFMNRQLSGLMRYPRYYEHMAGINRQGPKVYGELPLPPEIDIKEFQYFHGNGAYIIDLRDKVDFAREHIPNSYNFEFEITFANYVGWIIPFNAPLVLVIDNQDHLERVVTDLFRIGYENIAGYLSEGFAQWKEAGLPTKSFDTISVSDVVDIYKTSDFDLIDVRQEIELEENSLDQATHRFVADILENHSDLPQKGIVYCVSGQRAAIASSILSTHGHEIKLVADGGIEDIERYF